MKIAYDPQIFSAQIYGGVSRYFCEIASRLSKVPSTEVKIVAPMYANAYLKQLPQNIISGFHSPFPFDFMNLYQRVGSMLLGDVTLRFLKPDIVHETYYFQYPLGSRATKRVLTIYDMIHERYASQFRQGDKTAKYKAVAAERADHIICISESTKRDVIEILGVKPEKVSVIHLGFDLMSSSDMASDKSIDLIKKPYLLYVGNRGGYKNFSSLLQAYASSATLTTEFKLVCFGGGDFNVNEFALMQKLNLALDNVMHFSGDDSLLADLYKNAQAFIYPSLYEGFGIPPLEAMSYGCPVICSATSSIPEVVGDAGHYFNPGDIESMRVAIETVVGSVDLKESLKVNACERLKHFSWDKCAAETLAVYKTLI